MGFARDLPLEHPGPCGRAEITGNVLGQCIGHIALASPILRQNPLETARPRPVLVVYL